jgi:hypothetical protein
MPEYLAVAYASFKFIPNLFSNGIVGALLLETMREGFYSRSRRRR